MASTADLVVVLPDEPLQQDEEQCEIVVDGRRQRIRFHDYAAVYAVPGLYEHLFERLLECRSPEVVTRLLLRDRDPAGLAVLDFGAGNGMVGAELRRGGVGTSSGATCSRLRGRPRCATARASTTTTWCATSPTRWPPRRSTTTASPR